MSSGLFWHVNSTTYLSCQRERNLPSYPPEIRRISRIAQMHPSTNSSSTSTAFGTRTTATPSSPILFSWIVNEGKSTRRGKSLSLSFQAGIVDGMLGEDLIQYGEKFRIVLEGPGVRWDSGSGANGE